MSLRVSKMADAADVESKSSENILYDLSVFAEWKFENELFTRSNREKLNTLLIGRTSSLIKRSAWTFLRRVGMPMQMPTPCLLPEQLVRLKNSQTAWHIAVSSTGNMVAILQENCIEIRSQRDGLETVTGRGVFNHHDPYPQWRCVVWSEDETMVACSHSNGAVQCFDILGTLLFTIPGDPNDGVRHPDLSSAVAALIFTDHKPDDNIWSYELLVISHHGSLTSYFVDRDNGCKQRYTFVFATEYHRGISTVSYSSVYKILLVGGASLADSAMTSSPARLEGITVWRLLSDAPYFKLVTDYEEDKHQAKVAVSVLSKLSISSFIQWNSDQVDGIFHLCLSPNGRILVAIHFSGKLSMWDIPSLRLKKEVELESQPDWDELNANILENPTKRKRIKDLIPHKQLLDVNFWDDERLILARCTGAVSVVSLADFHNLLGSSPEWFEPSLQLTQALNGGFLALECEIHFPKKRIIMVGENEDDEDDDSDEEDASFMARTTRISNQVLYYLTDSERFRPPKKKPRFVTKLYRVVLLKSTTPEELYARKIEAEEYGEALALAQAYNLDCDLVYQRQWRKSQVSRASIQDYLNKISKRAWVLHECLERVPENIDAMRELLEYGLNGTDLPALVAVGKGEDGGRFILCDPDEGLYEDIYDKFNPESQRQQESKRAQIKQSYLDQVDFNNLNLEQKELCRARLKFLQYLDRLKTYECILGGPSAAVERYNAEFYTNFRSRNIFELATEYAQKTDWKAVETLMTFHNSDLASHRLAILSNFPETADPVDYKSLLPEIGDDDEVVPWETDIWRSPDWAEASACRKAIELGSEDEAAFLYTNISTKYRTETLSTALVQDWYYERACELEKRSRLVDYAIELVKLATERGVETLSELLDDLLTMNMLVYECGVEDTLAFSTLREMADYDKLELIMAKSSEEVYIKNLRRWMVPFLHRCEQKELDAYSRLLRDFVLTKAKMDLTYVLKIFESSKANVPPPVIKSQTELMSLVLDSLYSCERDDQLDLVTKIFECLPLRSSDSSKESSESLRLHKQVDQLEQHITAAKIFQAHGMKKTLAYIKLTENDPGESKSLMIKLTRLASKRAIPLSEMEWHKLHDDVIMLQNKVYRCITHSLCHEIFVESLMCSGSQDTIRFAGQMLERSCVETKPSRSLRGSGIDKVPYTKAVELALSAAREYFDSSANLSDPCMDLARSCLNLILDVPQPIQEELDLIASLALLDEFGVMVLPLQVRLSKNRLELVKKAVVTKPTSYKQTQRLLRLGQLLGISYVDSKECEGLILQMSAEAAVNALDYEFASQCCERLVCLCHSPAWSVCVKLAEQEGFRNIDTKANLLSFAMTYCNKDMIQPILQARCLLEIQKLYEQVNKIVNEDKEAASNTSRESPFSARAALKQTQQILSSTKRTTATVLSTLTDTKWWQSAMSSLKRPPGHREYGTGLKGQDRENTGFKKQGCHPFYAGIIEDCYEDLESADYLEVTRDCSSSDSVLSTNIFRTAKLEEMLMQGEKQEPAAEALLELAKQTMPKDASLGLAYLLATPKDYNAENCFEEFPGTDISLQLAVYFYALQVYSMMQPYTPPHVYALYRQTPSKIIARVLDYVTSCSETDLPAEIITHVKKLETYQGMLEDYNQACTLQRLGKGVDVIRFAEDPEYKKETIFGLAMNLDDEVYNISLSLAQRYNLPLWDVYMCHLEFLFSDSGLSTEELQTRVNKLDIVSALKERTTDFTEHMMTRVYPTLAGTDMKGLFYFFSLLETVPDKVLCGLSSAEHTALIKKLRPACPFLDYKVLMDISTVPLEVLRPCLTASNINPVAKLGPQIPDKKGGFLHPSSLYSCWASQLFWSPPENLAAWVHQYEAIGEWIQKLRPEDLLNLIDDIVFVPQARKLLDVSCREEITKRALKFSRKSGTGTKKKPEDSGEISWKECSTQLRTRLSHLGSLTNDTIQSFAQATDLTFFSYAERYDLSKGNLKEVELLLVQMILDGQAVELVDDILQVAPPSSLKTRTIVQQAVSLIAKALRGETLNKEINTRKSWLEVLQLVVENVREHQDNGGDLVQEEDVMSLLRSFCSDASIEVPPRLDVLKVLEKSFSLSDTDRILLILYRTDALVSLTWPEIKITEEEVLTDDSRLDLFSQLLGKSENKVHFVTLCHILILWPPFSSALNCDPVRSPWIRVFNALLASQEHNSGDLFSAVFRDQCSPFPLDVDCTQQISEVLLKHSQPTTAVKIILKSCHKGLLDKALNILSTLSEDAVDDDLLRLILCNKLSAQVVSMPVFSKIVDYILQIQCMPGEEDFASPFEVASQLATAGLEAEAGSLILKVRASHSLLHTFNSALTSVSYWFKKEHK